MSDYELTKTVVLLEQRVTILEEIIQRSMDQGTKDEAGEEEAAKETKKPKKEEKIVRP